MYCGETDATPVLFCRRGQDGYQKISSLQLLYSQDQPRAASWLPWMLIVLKGREIYSKNYYQKHNHLTSFLNMQNKAMDLQGPGYNSYESDKAINRDLTLNFSSAKTWFLTWTFAMVDIIKQL